MGKVAIPNTGVTDFGQPFGGDKNSTESTESTEITERAESTESIESKNTRNLDGIESTQRLENTTRGKHIRRHSHSVIWWCGTF